MGRSFSRGPISSNVIKFPDSLQFDIYVDQLAEIETVTNRKGKTFQKKVDDSSVSGLRTRFIPGTRISRTAIQSTIAVLSEQLFSSLTFDIFGPVVRVEIVCQSRHKEKLSQYLISEHQI